LKIDMQINPKDENDVKKEDKGQNRYIILS